MKAYQISKYFNRLLALQISVTPSSHTAWLFRLERQTCVNAIRKNISPEDLTPLIK